MNNDLISRSALKERAKTMLKIIGENNLSDYEQGKKYAFETAIDFIDNAPTVDCIEFNRAKELIKQAYQKGKDIRPQGEWISAEDELPEDMQKVLIWFEYYRYGDFNCMYQTYGFGYVCDGKWSPFINGETGWQDYRIIAWQPLPKPYKEGGEEE